MEVKSAEWSQDKKKMEKIEIRALKFSTELF